MVRPITVLLLAAACTPMDGASGYLLLDPDAREAGVRVFVDEHEVDGVLPEAVEPAAEVLLLLPALEVVEVFVEPGVVHHVQGPSGRVEPWFIGVDVGAEQVVVDATEQAADDLAAETGADVEEVVEGWVLTGPELWAELAVADVPDGLYETLPVSDMDLPGVVLSDGPLEAGRDALAREVLSWMPGAPSVEEAARAADAEGRRVAAAYDLGAPDWVVPPSAARQGATQVVGRYCRHDRVWLLDAVGTAWVDGERRGSWAVDELGRVALGDGTVLRMVRNGLVDDSGAVFADGVKGGCDDDAP